MTPHKLAAASEHSHQKAVFAFANCAALYGFEAAMDERSYSLKERALFDYANAFRIVPVPELSLLFAVHNQGHGDAVRGNKAKGEGVKAGVPDMMLPVPRRGFAGMFIELKLPGRETYQNFDCSDIQLDWHDNLRKQYYYVVVAFGWINAAQILQDYLAKDR